MTIRLFMALVVMIAVICYCTSSFAADGKTVVVTVNGIVLTNADLNQEIAKILPFEGNYHSGVSAEKLKEIKKKALDVLINMELQLQDATKKGVTLGKADLSREIGLLQAKYPTEEEYQNAVKNAGFTEQTMAHFIERNVISKRIKLQEVDKKVKVTDEQIAAYYNDNKEKYQKPEEYRASLILVKVPPSSSAEQRADYKKKADNILLTIRNGADFANIATEQSDDMSRIKGGDLGVLHAGQMEEEFEAQVRKLKVGEVSPVLETLKGYYIIKLNDKKGPRQIPFEEAKEKIKSHLIEKEKERLYNSWMDGLHAKAKIEYPAQTDSKE